MRNSFIRTLTALAAEDQRIWLVCGDLGFSVLEQFADAYPRRFVNVGVAEQNMTGVAAGLAMSGKVVFTYSIGNFPVVRCLEQIRNDVCYHNANVKIVAVGGGLSYGSQGYTHHAVEDLAVLRVLPNMTVVAPGDPVEARLATLALARQTGPGYLRLARSGEPTVHTTEPAFALGKAIHVLPGTDVTVISTGSSLAAAWEGCKRARQEGFTPALISMPTIAPMDVDAVLHASRRSRFLLTVEEHGEGGLASAVAEILATTGAAATLVPLRLPRGDTAANASADILLRENALTPEGVAAVVRRLLS